ncbi:thioesterase [Mycobacterium sp. 852013-51886_SCH5428379]|uniref:alpha/beta hydrolase n=1 Tax=Mycobacterium sp. 852013-51886_SCH5428379 TaxID=1834111 RepID=UPI0007FE26BB|nr:alpha/beta fold hydrolase [Mycobacterium sp. 852013-51886_SCH5428379]OBB56174.1 thioesterase [Mycobacterium sp. 852013-51886_SCH5428379]
MSGLTAVVEQPRAVVVALHGGASTAAYFDCPGHPELSLLRLGADLGYTMVALDRPGYGSSAPYAERADDPAQRTALAYGAVQAMLGDRPRGAGTFLVAHSNGCELALRMATDETAGRDVIGMEVAGTGFHYQDAARDILRDATATRRPSGLRALLWEPAELYPDNVLTGITNSSTGAPYEAGMVAHWPRTDFPALAARLRVPVHFSHAEHERVWRSDPEAISEIAAAFSAAPRFDSEFVADAGHNLSLGVNAADYHRTVLAFAEQCVAARRPAIGLETR